MLDVTRAGLAPYTTLRLGGPAQQLVTATHPDEIVETVRTLDAAGAPVWILAGGSNVVIADQGVAGTAVLLRSAGIQIRSGGDVTGSFGDEDVPVTVQAGQPWDDVVTQAVTEGLCGIECLSGVPGSAGATPIQNVGAYGQEVAETVVSVRVFDRWSGTVTDLGPADCGFAYRTSVFKHSERFVVLAVTFRLRRSRWSAPVRYAELARLLGIDIGERAPLGEVRGAVLALRAGKGMVLDPDDPDTYSVGSFFINPVLDATSYAAVRERAIDAVGAAPAGWPGAAGGVKVSAAWLIERAGFGKGYHGAHPGVAISTKHALALTNRGAGSTAALLALAREIRDGVAKLFDIELRPEPVLVNCSL